MNLLGLYFMKHQAIEKEQRDIAEFNAKKNKDLQKELEEDSADRENESKLTSVYRWVESHSQDGFVDSKSHAANLDIIFDSLYDRLEETKRENERLRDAAQAVIERWESPAWKDSEPTAEVIYRLRDTLWPNALLTKTQHKQ